MVLLGRKLLAVLHNVEFALRDVTDYGMHHLSGRNACAWLENDVPHRHFTIARDERRPLTQDALLDAFASSFSSPTAASARGVRSTSSDAAPSPSANVDRQLMLAILDLLVRVTIAP
jgi:hypothetical protein